MKRENVIAMENVIARYGHGKRALDGLSLNVERGQVYGFVGANGAGKTTAFNVLLGLLPPKDGEAHLLGEPFGAAPSAHRARVAAVSQNQSVYPLMCLAQLFRYLRPFYPQWSDEVAANLTKRFRLPLDQAVGALSGGEQRRAAIVLALATRAEVLLLDEPAANLDPVARRTLLEELADTLGEHEDTTVMFSTHILSDLERIADVVGMVDQGRLKFQMTTDAIAEQFCKVQVIAEDGALPDDITIPCQIGRGQREGRVFSTAAMLANDHLLDDLRSQPGLAVERLPVPLEDALIHLMEQDEGGAE